MADVARPRKQPRSIMTVFMGSPAVGDPNARARPYKYVTSGRGDIRMTRIHTVLGNVDILRRAPRVRGGYLGRCPRGAPVRTLRHGVPAFPPRRPLSFLRGPVDVGVGGRPRGPRRVRPEPPGHGSARPPPHPGGRPLGRLPIPRPVLPQGRRRAEAEGV